MEPQSGKKKGIIICPIVGSWVYFIIKLCLDSYVLIFFVVYSKNIHIYIVSLIIDIIGNLVASIFISISFEKNKYGLYKIGLIIILVLDIIMTILFSSSTGILTKNNILPAFILALFEWSQFIVIMIYNNKIKLSFLESGLNLNLLNNAPIQPQVLVESKVSV